LGRRSAVHAIELMLAAAALLAASGCATAARPDSTLDASAQALSSRVASDVVAGDVEALYPLLAPETQKLMSKSQLAGLFTEFNGYSGKPLGAQLRRRAAGQTAGGTWGRRPMWKFWYALDTSKAAPGTYFLTIQIVQEGGILRVAQLADVVITGDDPDLK